MLFGLSPTGIGSPTVASAPVSPTATVSPPRVAPKARVPSGDSTTSAGEMPTGTEPIFVYGALPASISRGTTIADATTTSPNTTIASSRSNRPRRPAGGSAGDVIVSVSSAPTRGVLTSGRG